ncbi:glycosyltransferase family 4 protein [Vibrio alginolyticus]|uniref:glycosyltransferase family 4 protein n=1 Tax=Vibrio sp. Vb1729 TaxID=3074644 RepID=UPI0029641BC9|nr:glycosyltransferase family 4 protein [Vibrio sp. Vb1729]EGQ9111189.1 glycosyltransferase [Vibrio alginolyticus]EJL6749802.1 glycosyltransferase family 4 protein [Vibrio alginolyticus]EMA9138552.1 glycosyltransferase family 4 protein [Vibrio alginolyticus]MDW1896651.1 glycosyltransferase family 4 protein [Vibrio sp. Vb1729]
MHILFLTDNFPPEGNAPASRTYEHAVRWVQQGHQVTIITCAPNFPEGKVFEGYSNRLYSSENLEGIKVVRVKTYITANEGFIKRTLDYLSFMFSGFIASLFQRRADVVVATSPQFFCACAGWAVSVVKRRPFIFELRDIWPASITAVGAMKDSKVIRLLESLELFLYRRADAIVSVTNSFKEELIKRGVDESKIEVVRNGVDLNCYKPQIKDKKLTVSYDLTNKFVVSYIGTHGMAHGLEHIVTVAERLKDHDGIRFCFAGGGASREKIVKLVKDRGLSNVVLIDRQPKETMPKLWSTCDVSLVPLINNSLFSTVIPSKIFECMAMGIPTIMSVPKGEATSILLESGAGLAVDSENVDEIVNAILTLYNDPVLYDQYRRNSLSAAKNFSRDVLANDLLSVLCSVHYRNKDV